MFFNVTERCKTTCTGPFGNVFQKEHLHVSLTFSWVHANVARTEYTGVSPHMCLPVNLNASIAHYV